MLTPMLHNFLEVSSASPPLAALHSMTEMKSNSGSGNPHGIDHILSRPSGLHRTFNNVTAAGMAAAAGIAAASYFHHNGAKHTSHSLADFTSRSSIYWPGIQGLVSNPMAWRDRLANSKYFLSFLLSLTYMFNGKNRKFKYNSNENNNKLFT